jgi:hypothetical protein
MKRHAPLATAIGILAWALTIGHAPDVRAQEPAARPIVNPKGTEYFRVMLHQAGLKPLTSIASLNEDPGKTLLIVFGDPEPLELLNDDDEIRTFLKRGGALLVASIYSVEALDSSLGVTPEGRIIVDRRPQKTFRGNRYCSFVEPTQPNHPIFREVERIATNAPTFLFLRPHCELSPLARFAPGCTDEQGRRIRSPAFFAAGNLGPTGKVLVLGGHGMFMNGPIGHKDNFTFTRNCLDWFLKGPNGERTRDRVLFFEEGRIHTKLNVSWRVIPGPPVPPFTELNRLIRGLDEENFLNKALLTAAGNSDMEDKTERMLDGKQRLVHWTIAILSAVLIFHGFGRLLKARYRFDTKVPLVANNLASTLPREPLVTQRHEGMVQAGNFWEAARALARQCFATYADRCAIHPPVKPRVTIAGGWSQRRALAKLIDKLWTLAYGSAPARISKREFLNVADEVDEVKVAYSSGILKLLEPSPSKPALVRGAVKPLAAT